MKTKALFLVLWICILAARLSAQPITLSAESITPQTFLKSKGLMSESNYSDSAHTFQNGSITFTALQYSTLHRAEGPKLVACFLISRLTGGDSMIVEAKSPAGISIFNGIINSDTLVLIQVFDRPGINGPTTLLCNGRLIDVDFTIVELRTDEHSLLLAGQSVYSRFSRQPDMWIKIPLAELP